VLRPGRLSQANHGLPRCLLAELDGQKALQLLTLEALHDAGSTRQGKMLWKKKIDEH